MKCLGAIFFKEQARIFCAANNFQGISPIFVSSHLSKNELVLMLIHVRKIFKSKMSFKCCFQCAS